VPVAPAAPEPIPVVPTALLGGPLLTLLPGERPSLGPLFPVVLPFIELPVVVELAACPPDAELPPALLPAPVPGLCANATVPDNASAAARANVLSFMVRPLWLERHQLDGIFDVPKFLRHASDDNAVIEGLNI
jgi:hypothetical protein